MASNESDAARHRAQGQPDAGRKPALREGDGNPRRLRRGSGRQCARGIRALPAERDGEVDEGGAGRGNHIAVTGKSLDTEDTEDTEENNSS